MRFKFLYPARGVRDAICLPNELQEKTSPQPSNCVDTEFETWAKDHGTEEATVASVKPKKTNKKPLPKGEEKIFQLEYEDEMAGKNTKQHYTCTYSDPYNIRELVAKNRFQPFQAFRLNMEALKLKQTQKIDRLIAVDAIRTKLVPYNFQLKTALQVINEMNANAILADEVGLGKTIEAGLIMKELLLREEINSILIVAPKSLLTQWKSEMQEKFGETFPHRQQTRRTRQLQNGQPHPLLAYASAAEV